MRIEDSRSNAILSPRFDSWPRTWAAPVAAMPDYRFHLVDVVGYDRQPAGADSTGAAPRSNADRIARYINEARLKRLAIVSHLVVGTFGLMMAARQLDVF